LNKGCVAAIAHGRFWHETAVIGFPTNVLGGKAVVRRTSLQ